MSELIPENAPEPAVVVTKRIMPGWAIALAVALAATCTAVCAILLTFRNENAYHQDIFNRCVQTNASSAKVIDVLRKLRNADAEILVAAQASGPQTPFGEVDLKGIKQRVDAYDELLAQVPKNPPSCDQLR